MALIGRLHPLLVHFPIALVLMAAAAEFVAEFLQATAYVLPLLALVGYRLRRTCTTPTARALHGLIGGDDHGQ